MNRPRPKKPDHKPPAEHDIPITLVTSSKNEIRKVIKSLNNSKSVGPDGIPAVVMKYALEITVNTFQYLFEKRGRKKPYQKNGKRVSSSNFQKRMT